MSEKYVMAFCGAFGLYGLQMLAVPQNMVTDHFETEATPMLKFWIRGQSVSLLGLCYCMNKMPTSEAVTVGAISSLAIGILYPWNAKFGYLKDKDFPEVKYPMHCAFPYAVNCCDVGVFLRRAQAASCLALWVC